MQPNRPGAPARASTPPFQQQYPPFSAPGSVSGGLSASVMQYPTAAVRSERPSMQGVQRPAASFPEASPGLPSVAPLSRPAAPHFQATAPLSSNGPSVTTTQPGSALSSVRGPIPVVRPPVAGGPGSGLVGSQPLTSFPGSSAFARPTPGTSTPSIPPPQPFSTQLQPGFMPGNLPPPVRQPSTEYPRGAPSGPAFGPPLAGGQPPQPPMFASRPMFPSSQPTTHIPSQYPPQGGIPTFPSSVSQPPMGTPYIDPQNIRGPPSYAPIGGPPTAGIQELVEDFQSLSVTPAPGSIEPRMDSTSLPRPLDESHIKDPPSSTVYTANCHSRFVRLTTNAIPNSQSLLARWHLPLGAVVHPLAESPTGEDIPVVDFGTSSIERCRRCRTYINPYVVFTDMGRRWRCNVCNLLNDVSAEYFAPLDEAGRRVDVEVRPELSKGTVEFVAPTEYMIRPPMPPTYFFLIDVSFAAVKSGMLKVSVETIKASLDKLPGFPRTQIGFLTFDSSLHFYNLKATLTQPQMMVVADLDEPFVPLPDDLLVNLSESRSVVDALLDSLPAMFEESNNIESAFGPALKAAFMVMSRLGGKLVIFQSTLPSLGVGRLKLRGDDMRIYGTDKEHTIRNAEDPFYKQMAADLTKYQIGVNLYIFGEKYTDLASLGTLAKYTGGQVYYYPYFNRSLHKEKFAHELARDLTRETAWEAVMRIRCGKGLRFSTYHGHFMLRSSDLLALPAVDCDKAFAVQLSLEDTLLTTQIMYFQVALLYTSSSGERRIRVHTMAAPVVTELNAMYHNADVGAVMGLLSRLAIEKTLSHKLEEARNTIFLRIVRCLKEYRNLFSVQHRLSGRLIYPESLKLLPIYGLALCKSLALRGGADVHIDERSACAFNIMVIPIRKLLQLLYPSLIRLDDYLVKSPTTGDNSAESFNYLALRAQNLEPAGLYLFDDGLRFILWLGRMLPTEFVKTLLGVEAANSPDLSKVPVVDQSTEISRKFSNILKMLREQDRSFYQHCYLVRQGEQPREGSLFLFNLVEDQIAGMTAYTDWIIQIHHQLQQKA